MTVGNRLGNTGLVSTNNTVGTTIAKDTLNVGFAPFKVESVTAVGPAATQLVAGNAGVLTVSGSGGAVTVTMPSASACPGAIFTFRSLSPHAHILTGSEAQGTLAFTSMAPVGVGSRLTLSGAIGAGVTMISDGVHFLVMGGVTGSVNGTAAFAIAGT